MKPARFYFKPFYGDPDNSFSIFDRSRKEFTGEFDYCVDVAVTYQEASSKVRRLNLAALRGEI